MVLIWAFSIPSNADHIAPLPVQKKREKDFNLVVVTSVSTAVKEIVSTLKMGIAPSYILEL